MNSGISNYFVKFIASDGSQSVGQLKIERIHERRESFENIWILDHIILIDNGHHVVAVHKDNMQPQSLFLHPKRRWPEMSVVHPSHSLGVQFVTFEFSNEASALKV